MMIIPTTQTTIARFAAGLYGVNLGNPTLNAVLADVNLSSANGINGLRTVLNSYYAPFAGQTSAQVAAIVVANAGIKAGDFGLTAANVAAAVAIVTAELNFAAPLGNQGSAIASILAAWSNNSVNDPVYGAAARAWNVKIDQANAYSLSATNTENVAFGAINTSFMVTAGNDTLTGTAGNDTFNAGQGTLGSNDVINGGAGLDTLKASIFGIVSPTISGVEVLEFQAQFRTADSGDNNLTNNQIVKVDFNTNVSSITGFTTITNSNSRADLIIEDVRISDTQKTEDITIVMRETDPGNVDYGVYFDQNSLRNVSSSASQINLRVLDTYNTFLGGAPLKDSPYGSFTFSYSLNGAAPVSVTLASQAIQDAQTFPQLVAALQAAANAAIAPSGVVTVSLGSNYSVPDSVSSTLVSGTEIVLSAPGSIVFSTPPGSGWTPSGVVPAISGLFTSFNVGGSTATGLVTSTIILDDVGRGSTGGDLVVGGLSVGETSTSKGVEKFNIEVQDNSKLQTINSTANTLREVVITSGVTTRVNNAFNENEKDAGALTVRGIETPNQNDPTGGGFGDNNDSLPGSLAQHNAFGFSDVRLLDASAFRGKLDIDAEMTVASIAKYLNLRDVAALPAGDNVAVTYLGGVNNDTIALTLDSTVASSRSTINAGREDFTFTLDGGAGNDALTLNVAGTLAGGEQAWYNNQKLNANITVNGGAGNDTIRTPGAGDVRINAGDGNDTVYTDNTGALITPTTGNGNGGLAALAYTNAAAAELAAALAARVLANAIGPVTSDGRFDGTPAGSAVTAAAVVAGLEALDALTPTNAPALPVITLASLAAATAAQAAAGAITLAQKVVLDAAFGSFTGAVITPAVGIGAPATLAGGAAGVGPNVTAAQLAAGDAQLAIYLTAARAAVAADAAATANVAVQNGLLNATQLAVVNNSLLVNGVEDLTTGPLEIGTATIVAALSALQSALVNGATQAQVVAAIDSASAKGLFGAPVMTTTAAALLVVAGVGAMDATEAAAVVALLSPIANQAALNNTAAVAALNAAIAANVTAVNVAAGIVAADPAAAAADVIANNFVGSNEAATAATNAATALAAANKDVAASQAINAALEGLKAAVNVGTLDAGITIAFQNANAAIAAAIVSAAAVPNGGTGVVTVNPLTLNQAALLLLVGSPGTAVDAAEELAFDIGALGVTNANSINSLITANTVQTALLTAVAADRAATVTATATASAIATAATQSGGTDATVAAPTAVYVFNTSNQTAAYNRVTSDDRNLADLRSDANNSNNFFNATVTVTFKGLDASVIVPGTGFRTTDLQLNQAIKQAINSDPVLNKLLVATDGPANTLVVTSLIDGVMTTANLAVTVTLPAVASLTAADVSGAAAVYGLPAASTAADILAFSTAAKAAFDTKGDYTTQFAESGAANGNVILVGANSVSSSDNTVTGGAGNDVIVLGTTASLNVISSSNEQVVFATGFGNDTIVNFAAAGMGIDQLNFAALGGNGTVAFGSLALDKSIVVAVAGATNDTLAKIAALFTDSATAMTHVYVAYNANNIGSVYTVTDAAGVAPGNVTAALVGTIDLADTSWATLTAANFV